jgi:prevent-host-death family protein
MTDSASIGLERARATLPDLVNEAGAGRSRIITRHGKPAAALVPLSLLPAQRAHKQPSLLTLRGTGRGLWGKDAAATVAALRDEWA